MATIKAIDSGTIHRIQSGQVIVDLCSVAKELIENSVDAGATSIDVRFKNQGLDAIEVQDNGSGISPENYASLALKHYTSKLSSYDDISNLQTFGFRGEALSSLCALSHLSVATCLASEAPRGSKLKFAQSGKVEEVSVVPTKPGTTVIVEKLFHNLPVRRRELERHIKREWSKLIALLNQYACILTRVKVTVSQQPNKGKKIVLFSTNGNATTRENVINIFGAKTMTGLIALDLSLAMDLSTSKGILVGAKKNGAIDGCLVKIKGHVSRPAHGEGRQTPDRQMFFVNGRPCNLPQLVKVFNEVYRSFNNSQSPFILADVQLDTHMYDVNVSPDKRTIMLHEQGRMLETLRQELNALFERQDYKVPATQLASQRASSMAKSSSVGPLVRKSSTSLAQAQDSYLVNMAEQVHVTPDGAMDEQTEQFTARSLDPTDRASKGNMTLSNWVTNFSAGSDAALDSAPPVITSTKKFLEAEEMSEHSMGETDDDMYTVTPARPVRPASEKSPEKSPPMTTSEDVEDDAPRVASHKPSEVPSRPSPPRREPVVPAVPSMDTPMSAADAPKLSRPDSSMPSFGNRLSQLFSAAATNDGPGVDLRTDNVEAALGDSEMSDAPLSPTSPASLQGDDVESINEAETAGESAEAGTKPEEDRCPASPSPSAAAENHQDETHVNDSPEVIAKARPEGESTSTVSRDVGVMKASNKQKDATSSYEQKIRVHPDTLKHMVDAWSDSLPPEDGADSSGNVGLEAGSASSDAEEKLSLSISKGDFARMRIIGQFNLGFILAVRPANGGEAAEVDDDSAPREDELFIIDQHASDEKYNFERLQASTVVQSQRLVHPKTLDLTALEEEIVLDNIGALETNGFKVTVDESGEQAVGSRCRLLALPLSKETTFTLTDLEELIALLGESHVRPDDSAATVPRPSKVRKMFAMRACRSSIMIGRALQHLQMEKLVRHMGELDKPWNCPHGRPTMRHLTSLTSTSRKPWDGDRQTSALAGLKGPRMSI